MGGVKLFDHIRHMLWDTIPALIISAVLYWIIGGSVANSTPNSEQLETLIDGLDSQIVIHPLLLLVPVVAISLILLKMPALPTLLLVSLMGALTALLVQERSVTDTFQSMDSGYSSCTEIAFVVEFLYI